MFEKFSKLLFEDEEYDEEEFDDEEEIDDEIEEVKPAKKSKVGSLFGKKASSLLSIDDDDDDEDIDEDLPVIVKKVEKPVASVQTKAEPIVESKPVEEKKEIEKVEEEKSFGLSVDEITPVEEVKPRPLTAKEVKQFDFGTQNKSKENPFASKPKNTLSGNVITNTPKKKVFTPTTDTYMFSPVISPMFGVDEKSMAQFNNTKKVVDEQMELAEMNAHSHKEQTIEDSTIKKVISPMYGSEILKAPVVINEPSETIDEVKEEPVNLEKTTEMPKIVPLDGSNNVQYQSLDDLIKEGRSSSSEESLEATKLFKFEDLLTDDEPAVEVEEKLESDKKVESPFSAYNLFSDIEDENE